MAVAVHTKVEIAAEFLEAAMQMFMEGKNYFCALHLAAAAAELFDAHRPDGTTSLFEMAWKAERGMRALETGRILTDKEAKEVINRSKNTIKHMNDGERTIEMDSITEAWWWIEQASIGFHRLGLKRTPNMWKYDDYLSARFKSQA